MLHVDGRKVMRPPCQVAQAQAPIQACLRPSMWLPGARNLHSARETWQIDVNLMEVMNIASTQLQELKLETEILELHKVSLPLAVCMCHCVVHAYCVCVCVGTKCE